MEPTCDCLGKRCTTVQHEVIIHAHCLSDMPARCLSGGASQGSKQVCEGRVVVARIPHSGLARLCKGHTSGHMMYHVVCWSRQVSG